MKNLFKSAKECKSLIHSGHVTVSMQNVKLIGKTRDQILEIAKEGIKVRLRNGHRDIKKRLIGDRAAKFAAKVLDRAGLI